MDEPMTDRTWLSTEAVRTAVAALCDAAFLVTAEGALGGASGLYAGDLVRYVACSGADWEERLAWRVIARACGREVPRG